MSLATRRAVALLVGVRWHVEPEQQRRFCLRDQQRRPTSQGTKHTSAIGRLPCRPSRQRQRSRRQRAYEGGARPATSRRQGREPPRRPVGFSLLDLTPLSFSCWTSH